MRASASSDLELALAESYWTVVKCPDAGRGHSRVVSEILFHHFSDTHRRIWQAN
jgi:hypothetical protein